jgi:homoserine dehydrogenase
VVSDIQNIVAILKATGGRSPHATADLHPLLACIHQHYCTISPMDDVVSRFYARFLTRDMPGVIGRLGTCFGDHDVSLESVVQIGFQDDLAEIVVVTHDVREGNFRKALAEIRGFEGVAEIPSVLRVL